MNENTRDELLAVLNEIGRASPDVRFGQLIVFLSNLAAGKPDLTWDVEDCDLLAAAQQHLANLTASQAVAPRA